MNRILFASALAATLAAAPLVASAGPNARDPAQRGAGGGRGGRHHERGGFGHRRGGLKVLKALDLTDAQKALLADGRAQAEPVRADLRTKLDALRNTPVTGEDAQQLRKDRRAKARELVEAASTQVEPSAVKFVAALSAEQKAKLAELATKHGRTFDEAKFTKRVAGAFLAPGRHGHRQRR